MLLIGISVKGSASERERLGICYVVVALATGALIVSPEGGRNWSQDDAVHARHTNTAAAA